MILNIAKCLTLGVWLVGFVYTLRIIGEYNRIGFMTVAASALWPLTWIAAAVGGIHGLFDEIRSEAEDDDD